MHISDVVCFSKFKPIDYSINIDSEDVIIMLCDDNWGNVRRVPNAKERKHPAKGRRTLSEERGELRTHRK